MSPEEKNMLERALALAEENNRILSKMYRTMRWSRLVRVVYWTILIGASVGIFYFIQPLLDQLGETYGSLSEGMSLFMPQ